MEYGYIINGQLILNATRTEQSKILVYTKEPEVDDHHATFFAWEEEPDRIVQVWGTIEIEPDPDPDPEVDDAEALEILLGGAE